MQPSILVIFASSRPHGTTRAAVAHVLEEIPHELVDLGNLHITPFDYDHANREDDFISLAERMVEHDVLILATPVYWYAPCAQMKVFLDRWSDLLTIRKDLGHRLAGRRLFAITSYATEFPTGYAGFDVPIRMSCEYVNIRYGGSFHAPASASSPRTTPELDEFRRRLMTPGAVESLPTGRHVTLRLATLDDRVPLYRWMYTSDASRAMFGPPIFPEKPPKSWDAFERSWALFYFQRPLTSRGHVLVIRRDGEDVGGIAFHAPDPKGRCELDIWLRSEADCGRGTGRDAIDALCRHLYVQLGIRLFWAMPSARNPRSVVTFTKVGFRRLPLTPDQGEAEFGARDYSDSIYLLRDMSTP